MNMRHGTKEHLRELSEQVKSPHIRSIKDVENDRIKRIYLKSKLLRRKELIKTLKKEGIPDILTDKLLPRVLHRKLVGLCKSIGVGVSLSEIYSHARISKVRSQELNKLWLAIEASHPLPIRST